MPTVSVVIPTFNRVESLKQALKSVLDQSFSDFEVVVVNDGSTDTTSDYLAGLKDSRIHYAEHAENRGGSAARNEGIKKSAGRFIAFLDDDDIWEATKLEEQVSALHREKADLCYTGVVQHSLGGLIKQRVFHVPCFSDPYKSIMDRNIFGTTSSVMVKKDLLDAIGGFDPSLPALQDWDLYIRLLKNGCRICGINKPFVKYNINDNSRKVSRSFISFRTAATRLRQKYKGDHFYPLLNGGLRHVWFVRHIQSGCFLRDSIRYHAGCLFKR